MMMKTKTTLLPLPSLTLSLTFLITTILLTLNTRSTTVYAYTTKNPTTTTTQRKGKFKSYLITGANKGQGLALCKRILTEHDDTHVFLCSRDLERGESAKQSLLLSLDNNDDNNGDIGGGDTARVRVEDSRIDVVQLDVTSQESVDAALARVQSILQTRCNDNENNNDDDDDDNNAQQQPSLSGIVSNAGILWGYPLPELMDVCATGVRRVLDAFVPLVDNNEDDDGRVVVVTSGLGPLMLGYANEGRRKALMSVDCTWDGTIEPMIQECLEVYHATASSLKKRISAFEQIGFPGGPFAESAPDFHMYGLAKMFGDAYMLHLSRQYPKLFVASVDPGLVYTDLILKMPKYRGKEIGETTAQSPEEGVEGAMRLLFDNHDDCVGDNDDDNDVVGKGLGGSGKLYAMNKERSGLLFSEIDKMPQKQV